MDITPGELSMRVFGFSSTDLHVSGVRYKRGMNARFDSLHLSRRLCRILRAASDTLLCMISVLAELVKIESGCVLVS